MSAKAGAGSYRLAYPDQRFMGVVDLTYATLNLRVWLQEQGEAIPKREDVVACMLKSTT